MTDFRGALITDLDGTVVRGCLEYKLGKILLKRGLVKAERFEKVLTLERERRLRRISHRVLNDAWVEALNTNGLEGVSRNDMEDAAREVIARDGEEVYPFMRELIAVCREENYFLGAITGSSQDVAVPFCEQYGFHEVVGTLYPHADGVHISGPGQFRAEKKDEVAKDMLRRHGLDHTTNFIGVGDTAADYPLLHIAPRAIAFEPNGELLDILSEPGQLELMRPFVVVRDSKDAITADAIVFDDGDGSHGVYQKRSCVLQDFLPRNVAERMRRRLGNRFKFPEARFFMRYPDDPDEP
jgi:phosphoserine phosphatase